MEIMHVILFCSYVKNSGCYGNKFKQEHHLAGADRSSIFFLKVKGLSFSITKEGWVE
ncbi:hypothetical protein DPMN_003056 [Dreissena polymorpha]|uniref:Uncharacterized protein n=1 Tax=Dreissena polymorpha TaxID=45954 RepID=A0A9D4MNI3_DREPO|nr:hypothetical protein DPMN_003056 [Dreissena polymorpha]